MNKETEYSPFGINNDPLILPKDLVYLVNRGSDVFRFLDPKYPEGVLIDDVREHTIRCIRISRNINIGNLDREKLERILWIHILSEIITSDSPELVREHMLEDNLQALNYKERESPKLLLTNKDLLFMEDFDKVGEYIKGKSNDTTFSPEALIAYCVDKIEGNLFFHYHISGWVMSPNYDESFAEDYEDAMVQTFRQYENIAGQINEIISEHPEANGICLDILSAQIGQIKGWWNEVGGIPDNVRGVIYGYS